MNLAYIIHTSILETWDGGKKRLGWLVLRSTGKMESDAHFQLEWQEDPHP